MLGAILIGCGGSGGGITPGSGQPFGTCLVATANGSVVYSTLWNASPAAASQVVQVLDRDRFPIRSDAVNRGGVAMSNLSLANLPAGVYIFRATLYSGANASGSVLGVGEIAVDLCASGPAGNTVPVNSEFNSTASSVQVFVNGLTLTQQQNMPYVATGVSGGRMVLLPPSSFTWSVQGGVGTIDANGQFTATTAGSGQVVANLAATSLQGSAQVTVTQQTVTTSKWTIMVFMNAANDLYTYSDDDINEMEQVASNPDVRVVVQWKQSKNVFAGSTFDGVRRYLVKQDTTSQVASQLLQSNLTVGGQALDMGNPQTLKDFIVWTKANYPANRYALIIWNHGAGWRRSPEDELPTRAFSYDDEYGTSIKTWQTDAALSGHHFDILAWDSSLMQMVECAQETAQYADFIVGSEESPPGEGYPYQLVFDDFRDNPDGTSLLLSKAFVDAMGFYGQSGQPYAARKITQSSVDTSKLPALMTSIDALALQLITHGPTVPTVIQSVRLNAQSYSPTSTRIYRDLVDVCLRLEAEATVPTSVKTACADVRLKVADAVVWEAHNGNSSGSHGLSIDFSDSGTFLPVRPDYIQLKFATTNWDEWLGLAP